MRTFTAQRLAGLLALLVITAIVIAQGPLTPLGAPGPTMKTLDQIEPRTIVNAINTPGDGSNTFIISAPGSYCLTGNLTAEAGMNGISIQADDVTLDLQGFALLGGGIGLRGIDAPNAQTSLHVRNGSVRGWTDGGVRIEPVVTALVEKLRFVDNAGAVGLGVGNGALVRDCVASGNGTGFKSGDRSQFLSCVSTINTGKGFEVTNYVMISDCTASRNGSYGFETGSICSILRCSATRNTFGIKANDGCTIADCTAGFNTGNGISVYQSTVARCTAGGNVFRGIENAGGSVADCTATENGENGITTLSATGCSAYRNGGDGILTNIASGCGGFYNGGSGIVSSTATNCEGSGNVVHGIGAFQNGSVTHCTAFQNGSHGIDVGNNGVVAFSVARVNNGSNNGSTNINAAAANRMLNNPAP